MKQFYLPLIALLTLLYSCGNNSEVKTTDNRDTSATKVNDETLTINVAEITLSATVAITMQDKNGQDLALGSGVIVGKGLIVTNLHVIAGSSFGYVQLPDSKTKHQIDGYLAIDKVNDLALLQVPTIESAPLTMQTELPKIGEKIYAAGNPHGLSGTFSDGIVSSHRDIDNKELIQITAPISPGSSGGPIVNSNAQIVGIAVGAMTNGQNLNFAIPSKYVSQLLDNKKELTTLNISKKKTQQNVETKKVNTDLRDAVKIRNLVWSHDSRKAQGFNDPFFLQDPNFLEELSILNTLNYPISGIKLFFIIYDRKGVPVDYGGLEILPYGSGKILPKLAKTFNPSLNLDKKIGYKCEVRILDFYIHTDN